MSLLLILGLGFLLLASAFFSGAEAAFFSLHRVHLRRMEHDARRRSGRVLRVLERPGDLLTTLLVGNILVNIAVSVLITTFSLRLLGARGVEVAIPVATVAVLIIGEVTPKTLGVNGPETVSRLLVDPYRFARIVLAPLVALVTFLSDLCLKALRLQPLLTDPRRIVSRAELGTVLEGADREGVMTQRESLLAQNILEFASTTAEEIMTPRIDMIAAPEDLDPDELARLAVEAKHSRIPIYRRTIDEIIGYLPVRDFLLYPQRRIAEHIRPVAIFPERAQASRIFYETQKTRIPMVVIVNEYGETVGLLTREDLLEEVVGDIYDEYEPGQAPFERSGEDLFVASGGANLEELSEAMEVEIPSDEAVTLNGFLTGLHRGIPRKGDKIVWGRLEFTILEAARHRIQRCQIRILRDAPRAASGEEWA